MQYILVICHLDRFWQLLRVADGGLAELLELRQAPAAITGQDVEDDVALDGVLGAQLAPEVRARDEAANADQAEVLAKGAVVLREAAAFERGHQQLAAYGRRRVLAHVPGEEAVNHRRRSYASATTHLR